MNPGCPATPWRTLLYSVVRSQRWRIAPTAAQGHMRVVYACASRRPVSEISSYAMGGPLLNKSTPVAQRIYHSPKCRCRLPPARIVKMVPGKRLAPILKHGEQLGQVHVPPENCIVREFPGHLMKAIDAGLLDVRHAGMVARTSDEQR